MARARRMAVHDRLDGRRERALRVLLERAQSDTRPLRRIAKRLGVYTTAVRLDAVSVAASRSRGMTSDHAHRSNADALGAAMQAAHVSDRSGWAAPGAAIRGAPRLPARPASCLRRCRGADRARERSCARALERLDEAVTVGTRDRARRSAHRGAARRRTCCAVRSGPSDAGRRCDRARTAACSRAGAICNAASSCWRRRCTTRSAATRRADSGLGRSRAATRPSNGSPRIAAELQG